MVALAIYISIFAQTITTFDAPGARPVPGQAWSIALNGSVTGFSFDPNSVLHGLVREADAALGSRKFNR